MSETILQVKNLKKYYMVGRKGLFGEKEYVKSVDGVSFTLHRGETLAIVGESGCGKSTTVKSLIRVTEPTSGEVILKGQDFLKLKGEELKKARRNIKMIFQDPYSSLNPRMTVRDINCCSKPRNWFSSSESAVSIIIGTCDRLRMTSHTP